jgi:hypothetical protein
MMENWNIGRKTSEVKGPLRSRIVPLKGIGSENWVFDEGSTVGREQERFK